MKEFIHQMVAPTLAAIGIISIFSAFSKGYISNNFTLAHPALMVIVGIAFLAAAVGYAMKLFRNG